MAELRFTAGTVTAAITLSNAAAKTLIDDYVILTNGPTTGTDTEKAKWMLRQLGAHIRETAGRQRRNQRQREAVDAAEADVAALPVWADAP